jgi:hypothetical protein
MKKSEIEVGKVYAVNGSRDIFRYGTYKSIVLGFGWEHGNSWNHYLPRRNGKGVLVLQSSLSGEGTSITAEALSYTEEQAQELFADETAARPPAGWRLAVVPLMHVRMLWEEFITQEKQYREDRQKANERRQAKTLKDREEAELISKELDAFGLKLVRVDSYSRSVRLTFEQYHQLVDRTGAN